MEIFYLKTLHNENETSFEKFQTLSRQNSKIPDIFQIFSKKSDFSRRFQTNLKILQISRLSRLRTNPVEML